MDNKSYLPEAQPDKRLVQPQIQRPRPMPIVLMIGTTHTLPETHQQKLKKKSTISTLIFPLILVFVIKTNHFNVILVKTVCIHYAVNHLLKLKKGEAF